jgi:putative hydrolase of the HAD superfamily
MLRALLFDLDGTLMDHDAARDAGFAAHLPAHAALADEWRRLEAIHYGEYASGRIPFQEQRRRRVRGIHAAIGRDEPAEDACDAWFTAYLAHYRAGWAAFDDVVPALDALAGAIPDVRLGIVTNGEGEPQRAKLAAIGLAERFPVVVCSAGAAARVDGVATIASLLDLSAALA